MTAAEKEELRNKIIEIVDEAMSYHLTTIVVEGYGYNPSSEIDGKADVLAEVKEALEKILKDYV